MPFGKLQVHNKICGVPEEMHYMVSWWQRGMTSDPWLHVTIDFWPVFLLKILQVFCEFWMKI